MNPGMFESGVLHRTRHDFYAVMKDEREKKQKRLLFSFQEQTAQSVIFFEFVETQCASNKVM